MNFTQKVPLEISDNVQTATPLTYANMCMMIGELYIESWKRVNSLQDNINNIGTQYSELVQSLRTEISDLKAQLKQYDAKQTS